MAQTFINTPQGQINVEDVTVTCGRKFRDAWILQDSVISIDMPLSKEILRNEIDEEVKIRASLGILWNGESFGYRNADDRDLKNSLLEMLKEGVASPHGGYIKNSSGNKIAMNDDEALQMLKILRTYIVTVVQKSHDGKDALPETEEGVLNYDVKTAIAWPSNTFSYP